MPIIPSATESLMNCLDGIPASSLPPATPAKIMAIATELPAIKPAAIALVEKWAKQKQLPIARVALEQLRQIEKGAK